MGSNGTLSLSSLDDSLSSDAFLGDKSLDSWGLVEGLVSLGDSAVVHVSADIIFLLEVEVGSDVSSSLLGKTVWLVGVGKTSNILLSLLDDAEGDNGKIWTTDASTDRLSLSLSSSLWLVESSTYRIRIILSCCNIKYARILDELEKTSLILELLLTSLEKNAGSSVDKNTLLHGKSIFVISSSDLEKVSLEIWAHVLSVNLLSHSLVEERTAM